MERADPVVVEPAQRRAQVQQRRRRDVGQDHVQRVAEAQLTKMLRVVALERARDRRDGDDPRRAHVVAPDQVEHARTHADARHEAHKVRAHRCRAARPVGAKRPEVLHKQHLVDHAVLWLGQVGAADDHAHKAVKLEQHQLGVEDAVDDARPEHGPVLRQALLAVLPPVVDQQQRHRTRHEALDKVLHVHVEAGDDRVAQVGAVDQRGQADARARAELVQARGQARELVGEDRALLEARPRCWCRWCRCCRCEGRRCGQPSLPVAGNVAHPLGAQRVVRPAIGPAIGLQREADGALQLRLLVLLVVVLVRRAPLGRRLSE
eukprot:Unigene14426_Nuclearia_a/m.43498 Unigene14426_Nuclearia_a/g.43498  ORF Unigene14426_Nuclearia_a/g.43498 Unigene14426_Nuclearia_a/m.43498 type:complete len:320 (-) Unigene14426_Nuclearia_a:49-1008(-)